MKKIILTYAILLIILSIYFILPDNFDPEESNEVFVYIPMVYANKCLYLQRGDVLYSIPNGWEYYGDIVKQVSQTDMMVKEELYSNSISPGARVFLNKDNLHSIYIEVNVNNITKYIEYKDE